VFQSWNLPRDLQLLRMAIQQDPSVGNIKQAVYVNFLLIILAILVVIFSIWGYHRLK
jgi:hypothetical protein